MRYKSTELSPQNPKQTTDKIVAMEWTSPKKFYFHEMNPFKTPNNRTFEVVFNRLTYQFEEVKIHTIEFGDFDIANYLSLLNQEEREKVERFVLPKRKREFIAIRILKQELFPDAEILYNELGAPYLSNGPYISISHAPGVAGIAYCRLHRIGFDLEPIREKVHRIKDKFLHENEKNSPYINSTEELITIWSAKESLYKLIGEEGVIFSEDLSIEFTKSPNLIGHYRQSGKWNHVKMTTFRQNETLLTVTGMHVQRS